MEDCVVRLTQLTDQLAPAEARVARYFIDHSYDVIGQPIESVSHACKTSKTTVVRLCKQLGYRGYKDFTVALSASLAHGDGHRISYQDIAPGDDLHTVCQQVSNHNQAVIADTMKVLSEEDLSRVVSAIDQAQRVDFYGVGTSALVALDAQQKFQRLCKDTQTNLDPHVQVVLTCRLAPGDVAVFFSYSGETEDILDTLHAAKKAGATTVSVTRYGNSRLSRLVDIPLYVAATETLIRSAAMTSRISMMHVVDLIYSAVVTQGYDRYKPLLDKTHLSGRDKRNRQKKGDALYRHTGRKNHD
ncbi:MAG: MurR/RpiR family transcriptional regulator [Clostridia bacterium]|nr:MurR/RpiR family transcriptional regulator [Clostridia bacterium]